jgi:hypothetical protein
VRRGPVNVRRYLRLAGCFPRWADVLLITLLFGGLAEWVLSERAETATGMFLLLFPLTAGTGLLTCAREGRLDLLVGASQSRGRIWRFALARSLGPSVGAALVLGASGVLRGGGPALTSAALRLAAVVTLTGGTCFAVGIVRPVYALGAFWIAARLGSLFSTVGMLFRADFRVWTLGGPAPSPWKTIAATFLFPEIVLENRLPLSYCLPAVSAGVMALLVSYRVFRKADFTGRRAE